MAHYNVCPDCGSHLDPGERCDCDTEVQAPKQKTPPLRGVEVTEIYDDLISRINKKVVHPTKDSPLQIPKMSKALKMR